MTVAARIPGWLFLVLLLTAATAWARGPRVIAIIDTQVGWAQLNATTFPIGTATAGMSDPAAFRDEASAMVTLGAGGRNVGVPAFQPPTRMRLQHLATGEWQVPPVAWNQLCAANRAARAEAQPGALGTALRAHCRTVLVASPDCAPLGALFAADHGGCLNAYMPIRSVEWAAPVFADAIVFLVPAQGGGLACLDDCAARFPGTPVLYLSVAPPRTRTGTVRDLTPVALLGRGEGLLTSQRTHWQGVVSAEDIAPTILTLAGLSPDALGGMPLRVTLRHHPARQVYRIALQARRSWIGLCWHFATWAILLGLPSLLLCLGLGRKRPCWRGWVLAGWAMPVMLVYVQPSLWFLPWWLLPLIFLIVWGNAAVYVARRPLSAAWGLTVSIGGGALLLSTFTNHYIARQPFLGLDITSGNRYYGIGNEGMGVMLILLTYWIGWAIMRRVARGSVLIVATYGLATVALGAAGWGANWGGAITAMLAGMLYLVIRYRRSLRWWHIPAALICIAAISTLFVVVLAWLNPLQATHMGALGLKIAHDGFSILWETIVHKLNFSLAIWRQDQGWLILLAGLVFALWLRAQQRRLAGLLPPELLEAVWVCWGTALLAGFINDSGVALVGLMWVAALPAVAVLMVEKERLGLIQGQTPNFSLE